MADSGTKTDPSSLLSNYSDLLCQEDQSCFNDQLQEPKQKPWCFVSEDEEDYVENMFEREAFFGFGSDSEEYCPAIVTQSWLKSARSESLEWIFNTRELFGFNFRTAYLSIAYFDRFLSKRHIDNGKFWAIRLLSVACLSLAAKIEECHSPMLSEFPVRDYHFESKVIRRMELLVLSTLEWKMGSMTPFSYLDYFVDKFCADRDEDNDQSSKGLVLSSAVELILAMTKETNLIDRRPSIVAACAVLVASDSQLTRKTIDLKISVIKFLRSQDMENVYSCCNLLQEIEKRELKTPQFSLSPNVLSSMHPGSRLNSAPSTKRRLTFTESDRSNPAKKVHRT